ncbi:MAG TPA: type II toxin-antitoxin system VapC family toxin [Gammaproteobacteria bacterium]|nr:type II toxin-antitoxin system VapC family toxin [Gammaproteobacteria bacterium]
MAQRYLLDTNICIYWLNTRHPRIVERLEAVPAGAVGMSVVTWGELQFGAAKSRQPAQARRNLDALAEAVPPLALPAEAAERYGELRATLERKGSPIGANDLWIAAHALAEACVLVTNNAREFKRVPKLKVENWAVQP